MVRTTANRIRKLRASGMAIDTIAETLNADAIAPRKGSQWYGSSVRNVLLRLMPTLKSQLIV
jgi:hypothetical protein